MLNILFVIIELFRYLLQLRRYKRKSVEVAVFRAQISDGRGLRPPTIVGVRKLEWLPFGVVSNNLQYIVWFCDKARVWQRDRQDSYILAINLGLHGRTDGQMDTFTTPNSQDRASIAESRGKSHPKDYFVRAFSRNNSRCSKCSLHVLVMTKNSASYPEHALTSSTCHKRGCSVLQIQILVIKQNKLSNTVNTE